MIKRGDRFEHKRILQEDNNNPAICTISKVANGVAYYKVGDETKAREYFTFDRETAVVKRWLEK